MPCIMHERGKAIDFCRLSLLLLLLSVMKILRTGDLEGIIINQEITIKIPKTQWVCT